MNRYIAAMTLGALGIVAAGCAAPPATATAPAKNDKPAATSTPTLAPGGGVDTQRGYGTEEVGTCKTPTGASAEAPASCESGCTWSTTSNQCVMSDNGVIVHDRKPTEH